MNTTPTTSTVVADISMSPEDRAPGSVRLTQSITFVTDGIASAVSRAREAAGIGEISILGGAETIDRALTAGVVDILRIHLSPVIMGEGTRLFDLVEGQIDLTQQDIVPTLNATHLTYGVSQAAAADIP